MSLNLNKSFLFTCILLLISIVYSKFLLSVSIIIMLALAILKSIRDKHSLGAYISNYKLSVLSLVFLIMLISGINSENLSEWLHHLKMKLPYLVIPFSLWVFKDMVIKYYGLFFQLFIAVIFFSTFSVFYYILSDYEAHLKALGVGHSAETPVDHIKYSIFLAFSILASLILITKEKVEMIPVPKWFYLIFSITGFVLLHLMAVRSGLALFYAVLIAVALIYIIRLKKYKWLIALLLFSIASPIVMYKTIPSLEAKIGYMRYDINEYLKGGGSQYSDSERWVSIQTGLELFKENPVLGVGIGDLREICSKRMREVLNYYPDKYPHNQFIFFLSGIGIIGFILFCIAFFTPWLQFKSGELLFIMMGILFLISFLVENTLERSYSIAFFCFFYGSAIIKSSDILTKKASS